MFNKSIGYEKIAIIDCQVAGISGDMFLAALLDLGADVNKVINAIRALKEFPEYKNLEINVRDVTRKNIRAKKVDFQAEKQPDVTAAKLLNIIENCLKKLDISYSANKFVMDSITTLLEAETKIHGKDLSDTHLHELGQADTPAEIIGSAVALEDLGLFNAKIYSTPVAVGGGIFKFSHGKVSSPALATLEILRARNFPFLGGPVEAELATPTGVSLLVNCVNEVVRFYPAMFPLKVGYGAGSKDFKEIPNILRIVLGKPYSFNLSRDEIMVLETNVDDVTGEVLGHVLNKLLAEGARDASFIPMFTKKSRPGYILKVITDKENVERLAQIIMKETGSLGVRFYSCERLVLLREEVPIEVVIDGIKAKVRVKVSRDIRGSIVQIKPEYDDVKEIADKTGKPFRFISEIIKSHAQKIILKEE